MSTRPHNFKEVPNHPRKKRGFKVWRCDNCDSEVLFGEKYGKRYINIVMTMRLRCLPREFFTN